MPRRSLSALTFREASVLLMALSYCTSVRLALWLLPSSTVLRYVARRVEAAGVAGQRSVGVAYIAWTVRAAGRRIPYSTCLVEALTVQLLLARHGYASELRIGVARDENEKFIAHAWVDVDGRTVVGARPGTRYTPMPDLRQILG